MYFLQENDLPESAGVETMPAEGPSTPGACADLHALREAKPSLPSTSICHTNTPDCGFRISGCTLRFPTLQAVFPLWLYLSPFPRPGEILSLLPLRLTARNVQYDQQSCPRHGRGCRVCSSYQSGIIPLCLINSCWKWRDFVRLGRSTQAQTFWSGQASGFPVALCW